MRYQLSKIIPVRFRSTFAHGVSGDDVQAGGHGNHFRDDNHADLVSVVWWQWRGRSFRQRNVSTCIGH